MSGSPASNEPAIIIIIIIIINLTKVITLIIVGQKVHTSSREYLKMIIKCTSVLLLLTSIGAPICLSCVFHIFGFGLQLRRGKVGLRLVFIVNCWAKHTIHNRRNKQSSVVQLYCRRRQEGAWESLDCSGASLMMRIIFDDHDFNGN